MRFFAEKGCDPVRKTDGAAGFDLVAKTDALVRRCHVTMVGTGVHVEIPDGYFGMMVVRSSVGKRGIFMPNSCGVIDSDYRGEIKMLLSSVGNDIYIKEGERIAQLIILPCLTDELEKVDTLSELTLTSRGAGGFGSTNS